VKTFIQRSKSSIVVVASNMVCLLMYEK
jgi:hypothetical protein